jgi:IS6 family transposase
MKECGLPVDHTTLFRWVQRYAPEINKRIRPHLKLARALLTAWTRLTSRSERLASITTRAGDKEGNTIEFMREREA